METDSESAKLEFLLQEYSEEQRRRKQYESESREINPTPGFSVKTWILANENANRQKVFINICSAPEIEIPSEHESDGQSQLRVRVSCGPPRTATDKLGRPCIVYDCVLAPESVRQCSDLKYRSFIVRLCMENIEIKHSNTLDRDCRYPKATFLGGRPLPQRIRWNKEVNSQKIEEIQIVDTCKKANHISGEIAPQKKRSNDQKLAVEQKSVILKAKEHISEDVTTPIVWKSLSADKTKHRFNVKYPISYFEISVAHADSVTVEESSWGVHINGDVNMDIARPFPLCRIRAQYRMRSKRLRIYFQQIPGDHESHAVDRQATAPKAHPLNAEAKNPSVAGTTLKNKLQFRLA